MTQLLSRDYLVDRRGDLTLIVDPGVHAAEPSDWLDRAALALARIGRPAVVVPKRLATDGRLAAMGDRVVHPKGLHGVGRGLPATCHRFPEETDGALRGFALLPTELASRLPPARGPLGLLATCLEARLLGAGVVALPEVAWREREAPGAIDPEAAAEFAERFGFHPLAPDIDAIAADERLAPLRWDRRYFGVALPFEKYSERGAFHWTAYAEHAPFRQRADHLTRFARDAFAGSPGPFLDLGCGDGLFTAKVSEALGAGATMIGIDDDGDALLSARSRAPAIDFRPGSIYGLDLAADSASGAFALDVIEHLHNPARALREVARVLRPGAAFILSTPEWQYSAMSDPTYHVCEYTLEELLGLLCAEGLFRIEQTARIGGPYRDIVVKARREAQRTG